MNKIWPVKPIQTQKPKLICILEDSKYQLPKWNIKAIPFCDGLDYVKPPPNTNERGYKYSKGNIK